MTRLDETHDPKRQSWVSSANGHADFPIQNLPLGIFSAPGSTKSCGGIAIGEMILALTSLSIDMNLPSVPAGNYQQLRAAQ
jgi:fumarylacetoacetase